MSDRLEGMLLALRSLPSPWITLQIAAAVSAAICFWRHCRMHAPDDARVLLRTFFLALPFGALGAYALGAAYRIAEWVWHPTDSLSFGNAAAYGALAGISVVYATLLHRRKISIAKSLDLIAPALAWLLAVGRIGCFAAGCDAGTVTGAPWAVRFPAGTAAFRAHVGEALVLENDAYSLAVHPVQLYETAAALVIAWFATRSLKRSDHTSGTIYATAAALYAGVRFSVEQLRPHEASWTGQSDAQLTSLLVLSVASWWVFRQRLNGPHMSRKSRGARAIPRASS